MINGFFDISLFLGSLLGCKRHVFLHALLELLHGVFLEIFLIDLLIAHEALQDISLHVSVKFVNLVVLAQAVFAT